MSKKLFSVILLASLFISSSSLLVASAPKVNSAVVTKEPEVQKEAPKVSVAKRAYDAVASTTNSAASGVKSAVVRTATASAAVVVSVYSMAWANKGLTCASLAALASVLLYNYNETFKAKVRSLFGLDDEVCRFCPASCKCETECTSN